MLRLLDTERDRALSEPTKSIEVADVRAQLDAALEEAAFLREQLRSAEAWRLHVVDTLRTRHRAVRETFVRDLASLVAGLERQTREADVLEEDARTPALDAPTLSPGANVPSGR